ncbi:MAG: hypothetical protein IH946_11320 [Bacteroidetes bacterium]|nr:hypothetical protein [Bacteroidota bacterium]
MIDAFQYYRDMDESNIMLLFKGVITSDLLSSILQITENRLQDLQEDSRTKKRVFNVLVECLQNVYHHMDSNKEEMDKDDEISDTEFTGTRRAAILMIGKQDSEYFIVTGNNVMKDKTDKLKERIDHLNTLTREELKDVYHDVLANEGFSDKGGAGLGFIDILRKSGEKLEYSIKSIDDKYSFFSLKAKISVNKIKVK